MNTVCADQEVTLWNALEVCRQVLDDPDSFVAAVIPPTILVIEEEEEEEELEGELEPEVVGEEEAGDEGEAEPDAEGS